MPMGTSEVTQKQVKALLENSEMGCSSTLFGSYSDGRRWIHTTQNGCEIEGVGRTLTDAYENLGFKLRPIREMMLEYQFHADSEED